MSNSTLLGIYEIRNKTNNKFYIGSSINLNARFIHHRGRLEKNEHKNQHLQSSWNKYGRDKFEFKPLIYCDRSTLYFYEQLFIDKLDPEYNICRFVRSKLGYVTPDDVKEKISAAQRGKKRRPHTKEESIAKSLRQLGKKHSKPRSKETREKLRQANLGKKQSQETIDKRAASNKGKVRTKEAREKMSKAQKERRKREALCRKKI